MKMTENKMRKIDATSAEAQSADLMAANIEKLRSVFPEVVIEGPNGIAVNLDVLKALVGEKTVTDADERYGLSWHGKRQARQLALTPSTGTLRPCPEESVDWDITQNLMIEGDNLEVLKLLQKSYAGKVKLIYIDPPYNTGKDFVYPDSFQDSIRNYLELTGQTEGGAKVSTNTDASGRFHTDWLNMVYPRLKLARNLLSQDGLIFISIGQAEIGNLLHVCNEVLGEENRIGIVGRTMKSGGNSGKFFSPNLEFIVAFARSAESAKGFKDRMSQSLMDTVYTQLQEGGPRNGQRYRTMGLYQASLTLGRSRNARYFIDCPDGTKCVPPEGKRWRVVESSYKSMLDNGNIEFKQTSTSPLIDEQGRQSQWNIYTKIWLEDRQEEGQIPVDIITKFENRHSAKELLEIGVPFPFAKPSGLIRHLLEISQTADKDLILDFFAGSGSTGHAVIAQNAADGEKRRFILVQLPELLNPEEADHQDAVRLCEELGRPKTLVELTKERLRRVRGIVRSEHPDFGGDAGFRVFRLDSSNIRAWNPADTSDVAQSLLSHADHLLEGRTAADVLTEVLLKLGLDLCVPTQCRTIAGMHVHSIAGGVLVTCLEPQIQAPDVEELAQGIVAWHKEQAPAGDTTCVFRDSAFADDVAKTNMAAILEQNGIANVRSL